MLLRHNVSRVGKIKFWPLVILPVVYFLSYEISYYQAFFPSSPVTASISSSLMLPILLFTYSANVSGLLVGIGFHSIARGTEKYSHARDYLIINTSL
jgi:hypothetical protein